MTGTSSASHACAQVRDDLPAYALGILDAGERAYVEEHLAGCPGCRSMLRRFETTVGALGGAVAPTAPPPDLRATLLREIRTPDAGAENSQPPPVRLRSFLRVGLGIAAVLALVSIVTLGVLLHRAQTERDAAIQGQQEMADYLKDGGTLSPLLPAPGAPAEVRPAHGSLAVAPNQDQAMIVVYDLAPTSGNQRYMVWAANGQDKVTLGELHVDASGAAWLLLHGPAPMSTYQRVGITRVTPDAPQGAPFLIAQMPRASGA